MRKLLLAASLVGAAGPAAAQQTGVVLTAGLAWRNRADPIGTGDSRLRRDAVLLHAALRRRLATGVAWTAGLSVVVGDEVVSEPLCVEGPDCFGGPLPEGRTDLAGTMYQARLGVVAAPPAWGGVVEVEAGPALAWVPSGSDGEVSPAGYASLVAHPIPGARRIGVGLEVSRLFPSRGNLGWVLSPTLSLRL